MYLSFRSRPKKGGSVEHRAGCQACGGGVTVGAGTTHAWLQAYLPGAGWVPFDPTNSPLGGCQLIRVAVVRDPRQASPISGAWYGDKEAFTDMTAQVQVQRIPTVGKAGSRS